MVASAWPLRDQLFVIPGTVAVLVYLVAIVVLRTFDDYERSAILRVFTSLRVERLRRRSGDNGTL
jgi:hypothetical protein